MPSPQSLRRLANVTQKVHDDLRKGGMGMTFRYLFRSTAILARVTAILADYVATQAGAPPNGGDESAGNLHVGNGNGDAEEGGVDGTCPTCGKDLDE